MTPSYQRAKQIRRLISGFVLYMKAKCLVKRFENETKKLMASKESSPHIVVGTPDSISCMIGQGALDNENIKLVVLDKAGERLSRPRDFCNPIK